jgi:hypothetical protein
VLEQYPALAHLKFGGNDIGTVGRGRLQASWCSQASGLRLQAPCTAFSLPSV